MAYNTMKKLILNANSSLSAGRMTADEYEIWWGNTLNKLDVFLACERLTAAQYEELIGMKQEQG